MKYARNIKIYDFDGWAPIATDEDICILTDVIRCEVICPLNGVFQCKFEYPEYGVNAKKIAMFCMLELSLADYNWHIDSVNQRFLIYQIERENGIIYVTAYHMSYALSWDAPEQYKKYAGNILPSAVLSDFESWQDNITGFQFSTSISSAGVEFEIDTIKPLFTIMMEYANAIGACWRFNNTLCSLRYPDIINIPFRYDSVVSNTRSDYDGENAYMFVTGKYIYYNNGYQIKKYKQQVITPHSGGNLPWNKVLELDLSSQFSDVPTTSSITDMVNSYIEANRDEIVNFKKMYDFTIIPDETMQTTTFWLGDIIYIQIPSESKLVEVQIKEFTFDVIRGKLTSVRVDKVTNDNNILYNIENVSTKTIKEDETKYAIVKQYQYTYGTINANAGVNITGTDLGVQAPEGYIPVAMGRIATGDASIAIRSYNYKATGSSAVLSLRNVSSDAVSNKTVTVEIMYFKKEHVTT